MQPYREVKDQGEQQNNSQGAGGKTSRQGMYAMPLFIEFYSGSMVSLKTRL